MKKGFLEATKYAAEHGNLEVPARYVTNNGFKLGAWVSRMRYRYTGYGNYAPLAEDQIRRLESIGIQWRTKFERPWESCFAEAERYFKKYGRLKVPQSYMNALTMRWENIRTVRWCTNLKMASAYPRTVEGVPMVPNDVVSEYRTKLSHWVQVQDQRYRQGRLEAEQYQRWEEMLHGGRQQGFRGAESKRRQFYPEDLQRVANA